MTSIRLVVISLAIGLGGLGILCNVMFYLSVTDGISSAFYGFIGFLFDCSKFTLIILVPIFIVNGKLQEAIILGTSWFALTFISLISAYGFLSNTYQDGENIKLTKSLEYSLAKADVETASKRLQELYMFADSKNLSDLQLEKKSLIAKKEKILSGTVQNSLGANVGTLSQLSKGCSIDNWYSRTYCTQITDIDKKIAHIDEKAGGYALYASALEAKKQALHTLSAITPAQDTSLSPVFTMLGVLFNLKSPVKVKAWFLAITSVLLELLSSLFFYIAQRLLIFVPTSTQAKFVCDTTHNVPKNLSTVYKNVKEAIKSGTFTNPSFKNLKTKFGLNQMEGKLVREKLIKERVVVLDSTRKLIPIGK